MLRQIAMMQDAEPGTRERLIEQDVERAVSQGRMGTILKAVDDPVLLLDEDTGLRIADLVMINRVVHNVLVRLGALDTARVIVHANVDDRGCHARRLLDNFLLEDPNIAWVGAA